MIGSVHCHATNMAPNYILVNPPPERVSTPNKAVSKLQQVQIGMTASQNLYTHWQPLRIEACRQADRSNAKEALV
ncbi:hypothetical protein RQCS_55890 [Rhodococcus qingshengii]|nr:hypothetical protein RQCS_55890 [Rhodococcus qingshengii]